MSWRSLWSVCLVLCVVPASMAQWAGVTDLNRDSHSSHKRVEQQAGIAFQRWLDSVDVQQAGQDWQPTISAAQLKVPVKAQSLLEKARKAFKKGNFTEMEHHLDKALTLFPRYADALAFRGALELNNESLDLAIADAKAAVEYDLSCATAYLILGIAYNSLNQPDEAIRVLDHALQLSPGNRWNYYEMGRALLSKGDYMPALRYADRALALSAKDDRACVHLLKAGAYVGLRNGASATHELQRIQELKPGETNILEGKRMLERIIASPGEE